MSVDLGVINTVLHPPLALLALDFIGSFSDADPVGPANQPTMFGFAWEVTSWPPGYGAVELVGQRRFWNPVFRWVTVPVTRTSFLGGKQLHGDVFEEHLAEGLRFFPEGLIHQVAFSIMPGVHLDLWAIRLT